MQVHSLVLDDFYKEEHSLIGVHTALEDYKLAYSLNQQLKINLKRDSFNLDFEKEKKKMKESDKAAMTFITRMGLSASTLCLLGSRTPAPLTNA